MTILMGLWLLLLVLVVGMLLFQAVIKLTGWAERLVWWVKDHATHR